MQPKVDDTPTPMAALAGPAAPHRVHVVTTVAEALPWQTRWENLVARSPDGNAFFAPYFVLSAMRHLPQASDLILLFVTAPDTSAWLSGVFVLQARDRIGGLPVRHYKGWSHHHVFYGEPLIDPAQEHQVWQAVRRWARRQGARFIDLPLVAPHGPGRMIERFERSVLKTNAAGPEAYLDTVGSAKSRKRWRRQTRRLSEKGVFEMRCLGASDPVEDWISAFLDLEARGWKGDAGTALSSNTAEARFFREMAIAAHEASALHMMGLFLDGKAIALQCNLVTASCGYAFKVAYDEDFASLSPGVLLEREAIRNFHERKTEFCVDSCAVEGHVLMGRLWLDTRLIERRLLTVGGAVSAVLVALLALGQHVRGRIGGTGK